MKRTASVAGSTMMILILLFLGACAPAAPAPTPPPAPAATALPTKAPALQALTATPAPAAPKPTVAPAPTGPTPIAPGPTAVASADKPKSGGVLKASIREDPARFDLHQAASFRDLQPLLPAYNLLVSIDLIDTTKVIPDLAQSWQVSPDGKVYTFSLNKDVKWHDGQPFTSADVKNTFERILIPPKGVFSPRQAYYGAIETIETPDPQTVKFTLKNPQPAFPTMLAVPFSVVFPKHILDTKGNMDKDIMGTGPFKLKEFIRGVSLSMEKNPNYFKPGRPYLDGILYYKISDEASAEAALRTKGVDILMPGHVNMPRSKREKLVKDIPQMTSEVKGVPVQIGLIPNFTRKPWSDVRVRKAAMLANDQEVPITVLTQGDAVRGGFMPPGPWAIPQEELEKMPGFRKPTEQDLAQARKLLAEAGFPQGFKTTFLTRGVSTYIAQGTVGKDQLAKIGVEVDLQIKETGAWEEQRRKGDFDAMVYGVVSVEINDPDIILSRYLSTSSGNYGKYNNPAYD
ncbi:MAG: ABC transporter substrate-binding protein, partial [Chloroflexota bacterium]|nr:ABC transporter substrate-binding protein [Chloroflexota bacterium]